MPRGVRSKEFGPVNEMTVGELIQASRITAGLTQEDLCAAVKAVKIPKATLSFWERNGSIPELPTINAIIVTLKSLTNDSNEYLDKLESYYKSQLQILYLRDVPPSNMDLIREEGDSYSDPDPAYFLREIIQLMSTERMGELLHQGITLLKKDKEDKDKWLAEYVAMTSEEKGRQAKTFKEISEWIIKYNDFAEKLASYVDSRL